MTWRGWWALVRSVLSETLRWIDDMPTRVHEPIDLGEDEQHPHPYCMRCREDWPCRRLVRYRAFQARRDTG